jgi:hypothetical protein
VTELTEQLPTLREFARREEMRSPKTLLISIVIAAQAALDQVAKDREPSPSMIESNTVFRDRISDLTIYVSCLSESLGSSFEDLVAAKLEREETLHGAESRRGPA